MNRTKILIILASVLVAGLATTSYARATPSPDFHKVNGEVFDNWEICRTTAHGEDGFYQLSKTSFRPVIAYESLGKESALAYSLGEKIAAKYPDKIQRAEAVFSFVRDRVRYTSDIDLFDYEEFAQNADELATDIGDEEIAPAEPPTAPTTAITKTDKPASTRPFPFFGMIMMLWLMSSFRRRRRVRSRR